jgi:exopolyphosphatase/guanosine-5'-triphosphate,3'-diphosphate pyrophosphatase
MRYAIVDLGSNTIRMSIYDKNNDGLRRILSEKEIIGIVAYIENSKLNDDGIDKIISTLRNFSETAAVIDSDEFCCFATASLRNISNTAEVLDKVYKAICIKIKVITGEEEAKLDFYGAYASCDFKRGLMVDMGGGSTELILFEGTKVLQAESLPFGSLFLYKKFVKNIMPDKKEIKEIDLFLNKRLSEVKWLEGCAKNACVIGGTARAIARLHMELMKVKPKSANSYNFDTPDLYIIQDYMNKNLSQSKDMIIRVAPERIHTIIPGIEGFSTIFRKVGCKSVTVSYNGVREGYLSHNVLKETKI